MSILRLAAVASMLICTDVALAQRWQPLVSAEDGFQMMVPGDMDVETIEYESEYGIVVPAHVYSHRNDSGLYRLTVVDFRDAQRLHEERIAALDDVYLPIYGEVDVRASIAFEASKIRQRAESLEYDNYHYINRVDGHQLHTTNADGTRTFAGIYLHRSRLYVLEATINPGSPPGGMFQQSLQFLDGNGEPVSYRHFDEVEKIIRAN